MTRLLRLFVVLVAPLPCLPCPAQDPASTVEDIDQVAGPMPEVFELSLDDALRIGLGSDLGLRIQEIVAESAGYDATGSWGDFDPVLTANASFRDSETEAEFTDPMTGLPTRDTITDESSSFDTGVLFPLTTGGSFEVTFGLTDSTQDSPFSVVPDESTVDVITAQFTQPLLRGAGYKVATSRQREMDLEYARQVEVVRRTRQELIATIENAYWDLVAAIDQLAVAEETLQLGMRQLEQNERRLDAGVGTEVEVLQAQATVAQREEDLLLRETVVDQASDELKAVLYPGTRADVWDTPIEPTTPLPEATGLLEDRLPPWTNALVVAIESRAELREQRIAIDQSEQVLLRSASDRKAALDLTLSTRSTGLSPDELDKALGWDFPTNTAALSFSLPIGNRAASNFERRARAQLRSANLVYDQLESQIVSEVRDAVRMLDYSAQAVVAAETSEGLARRQLEAEQARYREGLSTNFQVLEFQQQLAEASSSKTTASANLAKALTALDRAQGILGETGP